ncbi:hypothetical protein [Kutzneria albida]|uniref:Putative membrane protein n=1 Tax=Kutzneria albida DSM 43870 TaxID=1449976 RepID=W5W4G1_9PSEU|nr:hypothetical protein [Kutzneria albida]AHH95361.1 putative membrane protein [Kutzneria albida DSM 43870]
MTGRSGNTDGPEDVDAAFAEIVAGLERDGVGARWPEDQPATGQDSAAAAAEAAEDGRPVEPPAPASSWRAGEKDWDWALGSDEEHYVPPDPPPFPKPRVTTVVAVVLLLIGVGLIAVPGVVGLETAQATPLALIALTSGVGWLVLRMRQGPPSDDHGAQL